LATSQAVWLPLAMAHTLQVQLATPLAGAQASCLPPLTSTCWQVKPPGQSTSSVQLLAQNDPAAPPLAHTAGADHGALQSALVWHGAHWRTPTGAQ
jgi:hypothetical protein